MSNTSIPCSPAPIDNLQAGIAHVIYRFVEDKTTDGRRSDLYEQLARIGKVVMHPKRIELLARVRAGAVVVLDVRPVEEYEAGHVPGAVSLPLEHLEARLDDLDPALEVVAYCRGPLCLLAPQAVATLRERGRQARCLEDGMPEWRQAGLPVATGAGDRTPSDDT